MSAHDDPAQWPKTSRSERPHALDEIQPHGALLGVDRARGTVIVVSDNVTERLGVPPSALLGARLDELFDAASIDALDASVLPDAVVLSNPFHLRGAGKLAPDLHEVVAHVVGEVLVLEFEGVREGVAFAAPTDGVEGLFQFVRHTFGSASRAKTLPELCEVLARAVRGFLRFDKVMIYRFHPDGHGEVVAEDCEPSMERYLGLHFPEPDIPAQERALYLKSRLRIIPRVPYAPVGLVGDRRRTGDEPLIDLSGATLRSVSPGHVRYLEDMRVGASLSISLVVEGRLWGLVACHHRGPCFVSYARRSACELLADAISGQLALREQAEDPIEEARAGRLIASLLQAAAGRVDLFEFMADATGLICSLFDAVGFALLHKAEDEVELFGALPDAARAQMRAVRDRLDSAEEDVLVLETLDGLERADSVSRAPDEHDSGLGGALATHIAPELTLVVVRSSESRQIRWAVDPRRAVEWTPEGEPRLTPRGKAHVHVQAVRSRCSPWPARSASWITIVRSTVADVLARRAAGLMQRAAERANRVRREERLVRTLVAELKQPLFDAHAALAATDPSGKVAARVVAGEALTRLTERLAALAAAPDHAADSGGDALASLGLGSREIATSEPVEVGAALVCDRDRDHRKQLSALLHAAGIERASILEAELDSALIDTVVDGEIELVVLGVRGDSRLELEVIDQLVGLTSPPAIVVAATHVTETLRIHALALGAHEVVEKGAIAPHVLYGVLASAQLRAERAAHERSLLKHVEQRARELEEHAQVVSHDLKQPLSVLALDLSRIEAQLLRRGSDLVGEVRESCNEVRKLSSMIDDLLSVARAEHDALKLERVDLGVLVRNCIASHASELDAIGAVVAVDALPAVLATPALMEQVVRNLIANAIRYRSAAPLMLNVTCRTHAQHYELSFADNGVGVPAGSQEMIFGVFQRASEVSGGSGIGLAICRRIVERHGGRIWVEDSAEGGARFVVALPRNRRRAMR